MALFILHQKKKFLQLIQQRFVKKLVTELRRQLFLTSKA